MYKENKIIAIIPARGGSKRIPKKNIKELCGKPLIEWTIEQVLGSEYIDELYVSTDADDIAQVSKEAGAKIIKRPEEISGDEASTESALLHASEVLDHDYDVLALFQCTSPMRYIEQIDEAIEQFFEQQADSLMTGFENDYFLWDNSGNSLNYDYRNRPRSQDKDWEFIENGSFYLTKKWVLLEEENRLGGDISQYEMPKWMSFEIDTEEDLDIVEAIMEKRFLS